jgi:Alpha amylase, catalytic domain
MGMVSAISPGIVTRLPYLVELGVDAIRLAPIFARPMAALGAALGWCLPQAAADRQYSPTACGGQTGPSCCTESRDRRWCFLEFQPSRNSYKCCECREEGLRGDLPPACRAVPKLHVIEMVAIESASRPG